MLRRQDLISMATPGNPESLLDPFQHCSTPEYLLDIFQACEKNARDDLVWKNLLFNVPSR